MKIAILALLMVVVLTLVESQGGVGGIGGRLNGDLNNKLVQRDVGNGQRRHIRNVNKKHRVHMSNEGVPVARVA